MYEIVPAGAGPGAAGAASQRLGMVRARRGVVGVAATTWKKRSTKGSKRVCQPPQANSKWPAEHMAGEVYGRQEPALQL